jgi:hypothetical protein
MLGVPFETSPTAVQSSGFAHDISVTTLSGGADALWSTQVPAGSGDELVRGG